MVVMRCHFFFPILALIKQSYILYYYQGENGRLVFICLFILNFVEAKSDGVGGMQSLCNACGIRFKKEERRASAAAATSGTNGVPGGADSQHMLNSSWVHHSQAQKMPYLSSAYGNEFRFIDDDDRDSDNGVPFLSWRLNVTDRPSLVHDFTR